jgi:plastocyanin
MVVLMLGLFSAPAVLAGDPCYHGFVMPVATEEAATQIKMAPCAFAPTVAHVAAGSTVTFFNGPDETHLITGANQAWGSRDAEVQPGKTAAYRFDKPGIYPYACALHRGMSGAIVVGNAAAAGGAIQANAAHAADEATTKSATSPASEAAGGSGPTTAATIVAGALGLTVGAAAAWLALHRRPTPADSIGSTD